MGYAEYRVRKLAGVDLVELLENLSLENIKLIGIVDLDYIQNS